jgi:hypothetical protein
MLRSCFFFATGDIRNSLLSISIFRFFSITYRKLIPRLYLLSRFSMDDDTVRLYYVGQSLGGNVAFGVAKLCLDSGIDDDVHSMQGKWEREQASFSFF